jgi:hypothetical protein
VKGVPEFWLSAMKTNERLAIQVNYYYFTVYALSSIFCVGFLVLYVPLHFFLQIFSWLFAFDV